MLRFFRDRKTPDEYRRWQSMVDLGLQELNSSGVILSSFNRYQRPACVHLLRAAEILEELDTQLPPSLGVKGVREDETDDRTAVQKRIPEKYQNVVQEYLPEMRRLAHQPPFEEPDFNRDFERAIPQIRRGLEESFNEVSRTLQRVYVPFPARSWPLVVLVALAATVAAVSWLKPNLESSEWWDSNAPEPVAISLQEVAASKLSQIKEAGVPWNRLGNIIIPEGEDGLTVDFDALQHSSALEVSLDNNDDYRLDFILGSKAIAETTITSNTENPGLQIYDVDIPDEAATGGFDKVRIVAVRGDGLYSVGHLVLN